jgi:hypothetical protein
MRKFHKLVVTGVIASGTSLLVSSPSIAITQRAQQEAAGRAYRAAADTHNEVAKGAQRLQNGATWIRDHAWKAEKVLWGLWRK